MDNLIAVSILSRIGDYAVLRNHAEYALFVCEDCQPFDISDIEGPKEYPVLAMAVIGISGICVQYLDYLDVLKMHRALDEIYARG